MKSLLLSFALLLFLCHQAWPQSFSVLDSLPVGAYGTAAWGDYDGDGRKDLVYITQTATEGQPDIFRVYHNTVGGFIEAPQAFMPLFVPAACWADLDNDGKEDLLVSGVTGSFWGVTQLFKSNGDGSFTLMNDTLPGLSAGSIDVADFDNDGLKDIAASGMDNMGTPFSYIYRNTGGFQFKDIQAGLAGIYFGEMKWYDYDQDGKADIALNGFGENASRAFIYHNEGNDSFSLASPYMKGGAGTIDWFDYDGDGRKDLLIAGVDSTGGLNFTHLYHNNSGGTFTLQTNTHLPPFGEPVSTDIADFDGDGKPDICFGGGNDTFSVFSAMVKGSGSSNFPDVQPFLPMDVTNCIVAAADFDNDGDPDLLFGNFLLRNDGTTTGISTNNLPQVIVFPNPAEDVLKVQTGKALQASLVGLDGRTLLKQSLKPGLNTLNVARYPAGIYQLVLEQGTLRNVVTIVLRR